MKTIKTILASVLSLGLLASCNTSDKIQTVDYSKLEFVQQEQNRIVFHDLPEIEKASEMVIIAEVINDPVSEPEMRYDEFFRKETFFDIYSYSTIKVKQVLSGDVNVGDEIKIAQNCGVYEDQFITFSEMTPMLKGDTWIFFLHQMYEDTDGLYSCVGDSDGRYPLNNISYQSTGFTEYNDLGVYRRDSFKDDIYNALIEKYDL